MADSTTRSPEGRRWFPRALRWWAAGLAFVVGLFAGALLVGVLAGGAAIPSGADAVGAPTTASTGAQPSDSGAPAGATGEVAVNAACLRAVNAAQDVFDVVQNLGEALSSFNAGRLDEIVRELQPLQERLRSNLQDCDVATTITGGDAGSGSASPTTEKSQGD